MTEGIWVLVSALAALGAFYVAPLAWRRAAGGALILATVAIIALQLLGAL